MSVGVAQDGVEPAQSDEAQSREVREAAEAADAELAARLQASMWGEELPHAVNEVEVVRRTQVPALSLWT